MPLPPDYTVSTDDVHRSRQLLQESRALIAHARELIRQSRWLISQQTYLTIVCAWCQETIRWERCTGATWGQISHSICYACFAPIFWELHADRGAVP
jgi:hypothetical protein